MDSEWAVCIFTEMMLALLRSRFLLLLLACFIPIPDSYLGTFACLFGFLMDRKSFNVVEDPS
jgi:hypothetical protein